MAISAQAIKGLRDQTGLGMMECKTALEKNDGDVSKALEYLKERGISMAAKKEGRAAFQGRICSYIHFNGKVGVLLELNCETDFVANTEVFQELAKNICLQVCATSPMVVRREDLNPQTIEELKAEYMQEVKGKPPEIAAKIVEGKLCKLFFSQKCLMEQVFIKDEKGTATIKDLIKQAIAKVGENIVVSRFSRFEVGKQ
ncbi:MAG: translation elongation factor Ts [Planctomycetes bacterium]|nr:translation elongation factor Ts [Planctomycetota bacterium]